MQDNELSSYQPPKGYNKINYTATSSSDKEEQVWIIRVPKSVTLEKMKEMQFTNEDISVDSTKSIATLSNVRINTSSSSTTANPFQYKLYRTRSNINSGDLDSLSCFLPGKGKLTLAKNVQTFELLPEINIPSTKQLKKAGEALLTKEYTPRIQPYGMKMRWRPTGARRVSVE